MAETSEISNSLVPLGRQQARVLLEAGYLWLDMGHFDKAKEIFSGAAALMPRSEVPQLALGAVVFSLGLLETGLLAYRAGLGLAPQSSLPRAHAGEALLFMGKVPEALKELKAAMDLEPDGDGARLAQSLIQAKEAGVLPPAKT